MLYHTLLCLLISTISIIQARLRFQPPPHKMPSLSGTTPGSVVMKYFETKTDHFGQAPGETFQMRYLIDDSYFMNPNNTEKLRPILFYAGNEGDIY